MTRITSHAIGVFFLLLSPAVFGQGWPNQSKTPNTEVPCSAICTGKTVGYTTPISTFTGRFLDSVTTRDYQQNFRSARARTIAMSADGSRIYMRFGALVAAYDVKKFITRLEANEGLMSATEIPLTVASCPNGNGGFSSCQNFRVGAPEIFLRPDQYFYAEHASPWTCPYVDGQERLRNIDVDDRGYVYMAYGEFSWGIAKDDLKNDFSAMTSVFQYWPQLDSEGTPEQIFVVHAGDGHYYAAVNMGGAAARVWDVTNPASPIKLGFAPFQISAYAKNNAGMVAVSDLSGGVRVFTPDAVASGGNAIASFAAPSGGKYNLVGTDGTNFYASGNALGTLAVLVIKPSGGTYTGTPFVTGTNITAVNLRGTGGYLAIPGYPAEMLLYKIDANGGLTEVPIPAYRTGGKYFQQYYNSPPAGYAAPQQYVQANDALVLKVNNKPYLLYLAYGLADVYELKNGDGLSVNSLGVSGTPNGNTPVASRTKTIYGDPLSFTATTTATSAQGVSWNFGNPEAVNGADPNVVGGITGLPAVTHRYSGIGSAAGLTPRRVTASSSSDSSNLADVLVTMEAPVGRIGLLNTAFLFTQPNASSTMPIVAGDKWLDASDGTVESHTASWSLYNTATATGSPAVSSNLLPSGTFDAGQCGPHFVNFTGHYGQNGSVLPSTDYTAPVGGLGIGYQVRPFAAAVGISSTTGSANVTFSSSTRTTSDTAILSTAASSALQYKWDLLNADGSVASTPVGPGGSLSAIQPWSVAKSAIARGMKGRLTVTSPSDFTGACAGMTSSSFVTAALNPPDPKVTGSCNVGNCSFTVASRTAGVDPVADHWSYQWSISPLTASVDTASNSFSPIFTATGTYPVTATVTVTNDFGTAQDSLTTSVTIDAQKCQPIIPGTNLYITYGGATSGCSTALTTACGANESIGFGVQALGYSTACGQHTYNWTFGDGGSSTVQSPTHAYTASGTYTVKCIVNNGNPDATLTQSITVGGIINPCGTIVAGVNVLVNYSSASGACSSSGGSCSKNDPLTFSAQNFGNYSFSCGNHGFAWNWGDGQQSSGQVATHSYAADGTYTVTLTVTQPNGTQVPITKQVVVGTTQCGTMVANSNVSLSYVGSTCSTAGGTCKQNEGLSFSAVASSGYSFSCGLHNFAWQFGDGATTTGQNPAHAYAAQGSYTVTLTITNPNNQQAVITRQVTVGDSDCPAIIPGTSIFVDFRGPESQCSEINNNSVNCLANESIAFKPLTFQYPITCSTHTYAWDFGDGATSTQEIINHTYADPGVDKTYNVILRVTVKNVTTAIPQSVKVKARIIEKPVKSWDFSITPLVFNGEAVPNAYVFKAVTDPSDAIVPTWNWNFGDGSQTSGSSQQTHIFIDSRVYTVTLTIPGVQGSITHTVGTSRRRSSHH